MSGAIGGKLSLVAVGLATIYPVLAAADKAEEWGVSPVPAPDELPPQLPIHANSATAPAITAIQNP